MDTEGIKLFVIAAQLLNISSAGRQLGLAPAVASARLSKLETQVGADLLHRSTRKVSLSQEGAEFLPFAKEILEQEAAALAALGHGNLAVSGVLRFAASSTFYQQHIATIIPEFLERYPEVNLELKLTDIQMNLIEGGYDLALHNYAIEESGLRARKLANDKRILCASPHYLKQYGTPLTPDELEDHQLLMFSGGSTLKLESCDDQPSGKFPPSQVKNRILCDDGTSIKLTTMAGMGISMNSMWNVYKELQEGALVRVLPDYEVADNSAIWLVYPKSNVLTAKVRVFIDFLIEKIGQNPVWDEKD